MKDIKNYLIMEYKPWKYNSDMHGTEDEDLNIPPQANDTTGEAVKKLKIGESYDADGGINIYIRIKK